MNIEELKRLKEQLDSEKNYSVIWRNDICYDSSVGIMETKPLSEYVTENSTKEFVEQIESLIEKTVRRLGQTNFSYNYIELFTNTGYLCNTNFLRELRNKFDQDEISGERTGFIEDSIIANSSSTYVPLEFKILPSTVYSDIDECPHTLEDVKSGVEVINDLNIETVKGVVDIREFISRIQDLGYTFTSGDGNNVKSYDDFIRIRNEITECWFVGVDLSRNLDEENCSSKTKIYKKID